MISNPLLRLCVAASGFCLLTGSAFSQETQRIEAQEAQMQLLRQVPISTEVAGTMLSIDPKEIEEGLFVKKGDILIKLNDKVIRAEVARAQAQAEQKTEIEFAEKALAIEKINQEQKREANTRRPNAEVFTKSEMRQVDLEVEKAEASLRKAMDEHKLHQLDAKIKEEQLAQYTVLAPFDGMVAKVQRFAGQNVRPGDPVLTLVDTSELRASVKVHFKYRDLLFVGDKVEIRVDANRRIFGQQSAVQKPDAAPQASIFDSADSKAVAATPQVAPVEPEPSSTVRQKEELFIGQIKFIESAIETDATGAYLVKVSVGVPNPPDKYGRFQLFEGVPVKAVILARKRSE
jgi:multidrug resistance efflux pump